MEWGREEKLTLREEWVIGSWTGRGWKEDLAVTCPVSLNREESGRNPRTPIAGRVYRAREG